MRHPRTIMASFVITILATGTLYTQISKEFLPSETLARSLP